MVDYQHLRYFWVAAKEGSIARASEHLRLTPQTISGQLGLMEDSLDIPPFTWVGRNLDLQPLDTDQAQVRQHLVARLQRHHVARHQFLGGQGVVGAGSFMVRARRVPCDM